MSYSLRNHNLKEQEQKTAEPHFREQANAREASSKRCKSQLTNLSVFKLE